MTYGLCIERVSGIAEQELDRVSTCELIDSWLHLSVRMFLQSLLNVGDIKLDIRCAKHHKAEH